MVHLYYIQLYPVLVVALSILVLMLSIHSVEHMCSSVYHVDTMSHVHMFKCVTKSRYIELYLYTCTHVYRYMNMKTYVNVYTCCGTPQIYYMCRYSTHLFIKICTNHF